MNATNPVTKSTNDGSPVYPDDVYPDDLTHYLAIGRGGSWGKGKTWKLAVAQMNRRNCCREKNFDVFLVHKSTVVGDEGEFRQEAGHTAPEHCGAQVVINSTGRIELS